MPEWVETQVPEPVSAREAVCPTCRIVYNKSLGGCPDEHSREALLIGLVARLGPDYLYQIKTFPRRVLLGIDQRLNGGLVL